MQKNDPKCARISKQKSDVAQNLIDDFFFSTSDFP